MQGIPNIIFFVVIKIRNLIFDNIYIKDMKPLFTEEEYKKSKSDDKLPCQCEYCGKTFYCRKKYIKHILTVKKK
jgi:queuine/archaeosine tRNA-ribosyltransferase